MRLADGLRRIRAVVVSAAIYSLFRILKSTWKLEEDSLDPELTQRLSDGLPVVYAHFHEDEWACLGFFAHRHMNVLVSVSQDGALMATFLEMLGFSVARGSSSRRAAGGLLALIKGVRNSPHKAVSMAIDGPRGPRRRAKRGVFKLAESLNAPLVGGAPWADKAWVFKRSWSKAFIPMPFARVRICYTPTISAEKIRTALERDDYAELTYELEEKLKAAKSMAKSKLSS